MKEEQEQARMQKIEVTYAVKKGKKRSNERLL